MRCSYCGKTLTNRLSRSRGFGPNCYANKKIRNNYVKVAGDEYFATELFSAKYDKDSHKVEFFAQTLPLSNFSDSHELSNILKSILDNSQTKELDKEKFISMVLFDALIANADRHNENISFLSYKDEIFLSPMYDNTSCLGPHINEDYLTKLKCKITIDGKRASLPEYMNACYKVSPELTSLFLRKILGLEKDILENIEKNVSEENTKRLWKKFIGLKIEEIKQFLKVYHVG